MRISALAQISCDVRYRRLQDKSPKIQGKTALWSWARSLTARTTLSATTLRPANMATLSSRVLSIRPRSCEPRCKMHPQGRASYHHRGYGGGETEAKGSCHASRRYGRHGRHG